MITVVILKEKKGRIIFGEFFMLFYAHKSKTFGESNIELARQFEDALKKANKDVEVKYYEGSDINALFTNSSQFGDSFERASNFLRKKLKK